ncbi:MAG TPA: hypothetical protein VNZ64_15475 [Candidatus Acidoferrum sp.]|nr:hypothetical protein [Candidatus Acidoferrum sp.]
MKPALEPPVPAAALEQIAPLQEAAIGASRVDYALNVTVVYEDPATRRWASEFCERVAGLVGQDTVRRTWWKIGELSEPAVLAGAVSTALRADVIVVAVRAAEGLPLPFYVWVDAWLPHHRQGAAALVALIAMPDNPGARLDRARDYLQTVARRGCLDFLIEERKVTVDACAPPWQV